MTLRKCICCSLLLVPLSTPILLTGNKGNTPASSSTPPPYHVLLECCSASPLENHQAANRCFSNPTSCHTQGCIKDPSDPAALSCSPLLPLPLHPQRQCPRICLCLFKGSLSPRPASLCVSEQRWPHTRPGGEVYTLSLLGSGPPWGVILPHISGSAGDLEQCVHAGST